MPTSDLTALGFGWIILSVLSTISIIWGFYLPYWIVGSISLNGKKTTVYFGSFRRCNYPVFDIALKHFRMENKCGRYAEFGDIPTIYWQLATHILTKNSAILVGLLQVVSAIGVSCGCVIYPMGWGENPQVVDACGPAVGPYILGECKLGWAYIAMLLGSAITLVCGAISVCAIKDKRATHHTFRQLDSRAKQDQEDYYKPNYTRQFRNSSLEASRLIDLHGRVEEVRSSKARHKSLSSIK
uniref:Uncharacterized protein n=1 Tax=Ditylenchus dipsaci TaxID=166011 RepID=A0A915EKY5_9BILA